MKHTKLPSLEATNNPNRFVTDHLGQRLTVYRKPDHETWRLRIRHAQADRSWSLKTDDLKLAHARAHQKARLVLASEEAWDAEVGRATSGASAVTVGQVIDAYLKNPTPHTSKDSQIACVDRFRLLIRRSLGIDAPRSRFATKTEWQAHINSLIDRVLVRQLNADLVRRFQAKAIEGIPEGTQLETAKRSANSLLGDARAVFADRVIKSGIYPTLPDLTGFKSVPPLPAMKVHYRFETVDRWVRLAMEKIHELRKPDPAAYLLFRLAAECGLRRMEAMMARKNWLDLYRGQRVIYIQATEEWLPKGRKERRVPLPEELYHEILALTDGSDYLLPAATKNERKHGVGRRLSLWFDDIGWPFPKKAHELRRWFGAQVATQTGSLFAAQRLLGHSRVETTDQYYSDLVSVPEYSISLPAGTDENKVLDQAAGSGT